jgi:hypothetical protein
MAVLADDPGALLAARGVLRQAIVQGAVPEPPRVCRRRFCLSQAAMA